MSSKPLYLFITSSSFSGSTLLSFLLGIHPEMAVVSAVAGAKRVGRMDAYRCSCQKLMRECEHWLDVQNRMRAKGFADFDLADFKLNFRQDGPWIGRHRLGAKRYKQVQVFWEGLLAVWPGYSDHLRAVAARTEAFAESVLEATDKRVLLDATKQPTRIQFLLEHLNMEVKVMHLVRDVRGNVASVLRRPQNEGLSVAEAAKGWVDENKLILRYLEDVPEDRKLLVRYEDMCRDTEGSLKRLYSFCGLDPSVTLEKFRDQTSDQHILGNEMRLRASSEITLDERWRESLTNEHLQQIEDIAGPLMQRLYPSVS